jgi:hypothetical protein
VAGMPVGIVNDFKHGRGEGLLQLFCDLLLDAHGHRLQVHNLPP